MKLARWICALVVCLFILASSRHSVRAQWVPVIPVSGDYAGVGHAQRGIFNPNSGDWTIFYPMPQNGTDAYLVHWGAPGDIPVPGDYDGDGKTDLAVFRPAISGPMNGVWYVLQSHCNCLLTY